MSRFLYIPCEIFFADVIFAIRFSTCLLIGIFNGPYSAAINKRLRERIKKDLCLLEKGYKNKTDLKRTHFSQCKHRITVKGLCCLQYQMKY